MQFHRSRIALVAFGGWLIAGRAAFCVTSIATDGATEAEYLRMARRIDALLEQRWNAEHVSPAPLAGDGEFLRRAYLDLTGVIPRASEVRAFAADDRPEKRELLIEELLASPRHATHMATTWRNRILPLGVDPARGREAMALQKWLRTRFAKNLRYDNLVGDLMLATGGDELGPALYFQANDLAPEKMAGSVAELFLGIDLHCAQCHDHPFADWSQRDFWGLAAFFARLKAPDDDRMRMGGMAYRLVDAKEGDVKLPDSEEIVPPKYPRGAAAPDDAYSRRSELAIWMTSPDNRFFSRAAVNWAWAHLFGQGLVDSLNSLDEQNPSGNVQLLDELADYFVASGFDLRELWRTLAGTRAYQLSSRQDASQLASPDLFARMLPKPLTPEQLYDSFVILSPSVGPGGQRGGMALAGMAASLDENPIRLEFVRRMRTPPGDATEYRAGTLQALMLMNGPATSNVTGHEHSSLLGALGAPFMEHEDRIDALFIATLAREPDAEEREACVAALKECETEADRTRALSDILWALLNSTEFAFNH